MSTFLKRVIRHWSDGRFSSRIIITVPTLIFEPLDFLYFFTLLQLIKIIFIPIFPYLRIRFSNSLTPNTFYHYTKRRALPFRSENTNTDSSDSTFLKRIPRGLDIFYAYIEDLFIAYENEEYSSSKSSRNQNMAFLSMYQKYVRLQWNRILWQLRNRCRNQATNHFWKSWIPWSTIIRKWLMSFTVFLEWCNLIDDLSEDPPKYNHRYKTIFEGTTTDGTVRCPASSMVCMPSNLVSNLLQTQHYWYTRIIHLL